MESVPLRQPHKLYRPLWSLELTSDNSVSAIRIRPPNRKTAPNTKTKTPSVLGFSVGFDLGIVSSVYIDTCCNHRLITRDSRRLIRDEISDHFRHFIWLIVMQHVPSLINFNPVSILKKRLFSQLISLVELGILLV